MKAVVFVDVQKDFIDGALRNEKAIEVTPKIVEFAKDCIAKGHKLYATRDTHEKTEYGDNANVPASLMKVPIRGYMTTLEGQTLRVEHCIEGTDGWMIDDRLMEVFFAGYGKDETGIEDKNHPVYNCTFVNKPTFGSFDLAEIINEDFFETYQYCKDYRCPIKYCPRIEGQTLDEIILVGFCTSICVLANAVILRAKFPNVKITVMKDLCACVTDESHNAALKVFEMQQIDVK